MKGWIFSSTRSLPGTTIQGQKIQQPPIPYLIAPKFEESGCKATFFFEPLAQLQLRQRQSNCCNFKSATMAGQKAPRVKVDKTKKRKRDSNENGLIAKRVRPQDVNGELTEPTSTKDLVERLDSVDATWRISKPMGGRMLDIDPILTDDGEYVGKIHSYLQREMRR